MAASLTLDGTSMRRLAVAMALVMLMVSLPSIGVIVVSERSGPALSIDICHPLPSLETSTGALLIARPAQIETGAMILAQEPVARNVQTLKTKFAETPDSPPPKPLS